MKRTPDRSRMRIDGVLASRSVSLEVVTTSNSPMTARTSDTRRHDERCRLRRGDRVRRVM